MGKEYYYIFEERKEEYLTKYIKYNKLELWKIKKLNYI